MSPPALLSKQEPEYTAEARDAYVQGTAVFFLVVNKQGEPQDIEVISPIGFGLDEKALAAIEQWRFRPGMKDGQPVNVAATIEVNFRLLDTYFDEKSEHRRTRFNLALPELKRDEKARAKAVETIQELAKQKYPPAVSLLGKWMLEGKLVPRDPVQARRLLEQAAKKHHGPAVFELGRMQLEGEGTDRNPAEGLRQIHEASTLGSAEAQFFLAGQAETAGDFTEARRYYRLCAAQAQAPCQYKIGQLLLERAEHREHFFLQGIAWLQLAARQGFQAARTRLDSEQPKLTAAQRESVDRLATQLVHRQ